MVTFVPASQNPQTIDRRGAAARTIPSPTALEKAKLGAGGGAAAATAAGVPLLLSKSRRRRGKALVRDAKVGGGSHREKQR